MAERTVTDGFLGKLSKPGVCLYWRTKYKKILRQFIKDDAIWFKLLSLNKSVKKFSFKNGKVRQFIFRLNFFRYQASHITTVHGCVCTEPTGSCNEVNRTRQFQLEKVIQRRENEQNYCYSLHYKSKAPFGEEVFKK